MRKLGWYAVSALVAIFILGSILVLAANLYVQSPGVQQRIRVELRTRLKLPVAIRKTTITPWEGLRLDGVVLRAADPDAGNEGENARAPDFLFVASFRVRPAWWPLLIQQRVAIDEILLDQPRLAWTQDAGGRWEYPPGAGFVPTNRLSPEPAAGSASLEGSVPLSVFPTTPAVPSQSTPRPDELAIAPTVSPTPKRPRAHDRLENALRLPADSAQLFATIVARIRLRHGSLEFLNDQHHLLGRVDELNVDGRITDLHRASGAFWFERASLPRTGLSLTNYRSAFAYDEAQGLSFRDGVGQLAGGELRTDYRLQPQLEGAPYSARCRLANVSLGQLVRGPANQPPLLEGRLHGGLDLRGSADQPENLTGSGRFWLADARVRDFPLLQALGSVLRIEDLSRLEFKKAQLDYRVDGPTLRIDPLVMASNDLQITAHGDYATDSDQLDLHARLIIDQAIGRQLPQFIASNFISCESDQTGSRYIDFDVTGRLDDPKSNLYEKVMAGPVRGLLDNLLAPKPKPAKPNKGLHHHDPKTTPPTDNGGS